MRIELRVDDAEIEHGTKGDPGQCAVAGALLNHFVDYDRVVQVTPDQIDVTVDDSRYDCTPDAELKQFISDFDNGVKVEPRTFNLWFEKV